MTAAPDRLWLWLPWRAIFPVAWTAAIASLTFAQKQPLFRWLCWPDSRGFEAPSHDPVYGAWEYLYFVPM